LAHFLKSRECMQIAKCFEILHVESDAPWQVVKKSYYNLAKRLHPDINPRNPDAESKLKEINQAFQILKSHFKNSVGMSLVKLDASQKPWNNFIQRIRHNPQLKKLKEDCSKYLSQLDTFVFQLNVHKKIEVPVSTARSGASIVMKSGREKFEVKIPSGDWNQMSICVPGKGESSLFSKKRGDLMLNLQAQQAVISGDSCFSYEMTIDRTKIGRVMTLNSSDGPIKFVLPRNTENGQSFSLKSKADTKRQHILTVRLK